jgi:transketolase
MTATTTTATTAPATMRDAFADVVSRELDADPRVALVLADISSDAFEGVAARHPERVINVGIREALMVSVAGGMGLTGLRPIAHSYAPFLIERAFEQVKLDLGHQDVEAVLVSIGGSYDASAAGRTHQSPGDVALLDTLPGWTVHVPGHPVEAAALLTDAVRARGRVYVRLSTITNDEPFAVADGRLRVVRRGAQGVVLAVGPTLSATLAATAGLDVTVLYAATVRPFDTAGLRAAAIGAEPAIVLVEPYLAGTSAHVIARALPDVPHRLLGLGVSRDFELHRYGTTDDHAAAHGIDAAGIGAAVRRFLALSAG